MRATVHVALRCMDNAIHWYSPRRKNAFAPTITRTPCSQFKYRGNKISHFVQILKNCWTSP